MTAFQWVFQRHYNVERHGYVPSCYSINKLLRNFEEMGSALKKKPLEVQRTLEDIESVRASDARSPIQSARKRISNSIRPTEIRTSRNETEGSSEEEAQREDRDRGRGEKYFDGSGKAREVERTRFSSVENIVLAVLPLPSPFLLTVSSVHIDGSGVRPVRVPVFIDLGFSGTCTICFDDEAGIGFGVLYPRV
ncbi:hypothetical protein Trydic_g10306 [Trypoxylus dichotomus]